MVLVLMLWTASLFENIREICFIIDKSELFENRTICLAVFIMIIPLPGCSKTRQIGPVFGSHLKTEPVDNQTQIEHPNTVLVLYSDHYYIYKVNIRNTDYSIIRMVDLCPEVEYVVWFSNGNKMADHSKTSQICPVFKWFQVI